MRILFVNYEYPPIGGGGANANAYLFREFARRDDLQIDFVTSAPGDRCERRQLFPNITGYFLPVAKRDLHYWRESEILRFLYRGRRQCRELLKHNAYDLCHCFFGFPSGVLGWWFAGRVPYIVSLRGSDVPGFNLRFTLHYRGLTPLFRRIWRRAAAVVVNSEGLGALARTTAPDVAYEVIPNAVDTQEFTPAPSRSDQAFTVLCVARLIERKGVQFLVAAWPEVSRAVPGAQLVIVGEGDMAERLREQAQALGMAAHIAFRGRLPHAELPAVYRAADVFALASMNEGMSNTVLEAMASGLPVVSTDTGGSAELLGDNARLVAHRDPVALAQVLIELARDGAERARMGRALRAAAETMSWQTVAARYVELYGQCAMARLSPPADKRQM